MDDLSIDELQAITGLEIVYHWLSKEMSQDQKREFASHCVILAKEYGLSEDQIANITNLSQLPNADDAAHEASKQLKIDSYWHSKKGDTQANYLKAYEDQIDFIQRCLKGECDGKR